MNYELPCRIILVSPPTLIGFSLQKGWDELVDYTESDGSDISFHFSVRVKVQEDRSPNFLSPYAQGKPSERFVYVCIGRRAGQASTFANGRAKVRLSGIDWPMMEHVIQADGGVLVARYAATGRSGAPATATVPLLDGGWQPQL
jgi:hypothetical protein